MIGACGKGYNYSCFETACVTYLYCFASRLGKEKLWHFQFKGTELFRST
jgi:hypothetical protein